MPIWKGYAHLLVFIDTFTGWIEAFPIRSEQALEVVKILLKEVILGLDCLDLFRVIMDPLSHPESHGVSKGLGIKYYLHTAWSHNHQERLREPVKFSNRL